MPKSTSQFSKSFFILIISLSLHLFPQNQEKTATDRKMSCNGCRVLRKGCGDDCVLRPCLEWIGSPDAQAHATLFLSKFFGRSDLVNLISAVTAGHQRTALFQSLLYEAAGRTVNPVNGAMGLLSTGNWHVCEAAVQTVLAGGSPEVDDGNWVPVVDESSDGFQLSDVMGRRSDGEEQKLLNLFE